MCKAHSSCGFSHNVDFNASFNISQIGKILFEQVVVNKSIVTIDEGTCSLHNKSYDISCKHTNSLLGKFIARYFIY